MRTLTVKDFRVAGDADQNCQNSGLRLQSRLPGTDAKFRQ
jgi:hypothetical protein